MALNIATNITNTLDNYSLDAKQVKGTYVVVATVADRDGLPPATTIKGSLCYVSDTGVFYQYNGSGWDEWSTGGVKLITYATYQATEFKQNSFIEFKGRAYVCLADVVGELSNAPDTEGGVAYWKPMNSTSMVGTDTPANIVNGDLWYDTTTTN